MSALHVCHGCSKSFKRDSDRTRHLRNTKDPRCLVVAQDEFGYVPQPQIEVDVDGSFPDASWPGDFFGSQDQYKDMDFPMSVDDVSTTNNQHFGSQQAGPSRFTGAMSNSDSEDDETEPSMPQLEETESDEDEDKENESEEDDDSDIEDVNPADIAQLVDQIATASFAPLRTPSPSPSHSSDSSSDSSYAPSSTSTSSTSSDDLSEEFGRVLDYDELQTLHQQLSSKPVVERFPAHLGNPGAPVSRDHRHAYEKSRDALDGEARENVYAPLSCQMEWDFARWAKLRGPSSTALTELLKIDGVRLPLLCLALPVSLLMYILVL